VLDGDRERTAIEGIGGAGVWFVVLGDDGRELLELREDGRDGNKLNLMLDTFLTDRPRSEAPSTLPAWASSAILTVSGFVLSCRGPGTRCSGQGPRKDDGCRVAEVVLGRGIDDAHWGGCWTGYWRWRQHLHWHKPREQCHEVVGEGGIEVVVAMVVVVVVRSRS
jgi:hypothetical protein